MLTEAQRRSCELYERTGMLPQGYDAIGWTPELCSPVLSGDARLEPMCQAPEWLEVVNVPGTDSPFVRHPGRPAGERTQVWLRVQCDGRARFVEMPLQWVVENYDAIEGTEPLRAAIAYIVDRDNARTPAELDAEARQWLSQLEQWRKDNALAECQAGEIREWHWEDLIPEPMKQLPHGLVGGAIGAAGGALLGAAVGTPFKRSGLGGLLGAALGGATGAYLERKGRRKPRRCRRAA